MIPDAAVEAGLYAWGFSAQNIDRRRETLKHILEAAAPHMLADARFEAWEEGMSYALPGTQRGIETFDAMRKSNPYRNTK